MFCLSKGLCAPVGSLLVGRHSFIEEARYKRKIMGGGMRQAGVLAAAGLVALAGHTSLLAEDHRRARELEKALAEIPGIKAEKGDINMVFFSRNVHNAAYPTTALAEKTVELFRNRGISINAPEITMKHGEIELVFRFVTHYWIGDGELASIMEAARSIFTSVEF
jgi:threonine aldolase